MGSLKRKKPWCMATSWPIQKKRTRKTRGQWACEHGRHFLRERKEENEKSRRTVSMGIDGSLKRSKEWCMATPRRERDESKRKGWEQEGMGIDGLLKRSKEWCMAASREKEKKKTRKGMRARRDGHRWVSKRSKEWCMAASRQKEKMKSKTQPFCVVEHGIQYSSHRWVTQEWCIGTVCKVEVGQGYVGGG